MRGPRALGTLLLPVALAAGAGCASTQQAGADADPTGCYQFVRNDGARALGLPWGFELFDAPLEGWPNIPDGREARTRVTAEEVRDHPIGFWMPTESDSLRVGSPAGGGFSLVFVPEGQDLVGTGRAVGDVVRPGESFEMRQARAVVARRVVCPAVSE